MLSQMMSFLISLFFSSAVIDIYKHVNEFHESTDTCNITENIYAPTDSLHNHEVIWIGELHSIDLQVKDAGTVNGSERVVTVNLIKDQTQLDEQKRIDESISDGAVKLDKKVEEGLIKVDEKIQKRIAELEVKLKEFQEMEESKQRRNRKRWFRFLRFRKKKKDEPTISTPLPSPALAPQPMVLHIHIPPDNNSIPTVPPPTQETVKPDPPVEISQPDSSAEILQANTPEEVPQEEVPQEELPSVDPEQEGKDVSQNSEKSSKSSAVPIQIIANIHPIKKERENWSSESKVKEKSKHSISSRGDLKPKKLPNPEENPVRKVYFEEKLPSVPESPPPTLGSDKKVSNIEIIADIRPMASNESIDSKFSMPSRIRTKRTNAPSTDNLSQKSDRRQSFDRRKHPFDELVDSPSDSPQKREKGTKRFQHPLSVSGDESSLESFRDRRTQHPFDKLIDSPPDSPVERAKDRKSQHSFRGSEDDQRSVSSRGSDQRWSKYSPSDSGDERKSKLSKSSMTVEGVIDIGSTEDVNSRIKWLEDAKRASTQVHKPHEQAAQPVRIVRFAEELINPRTDRDSKISELLQDESPRSPFSFKSTSSYRSNPALPVTTQEKPRVVYFTDENQESQSKTTFSPMKYTPTPSQKVTIKPFGESQKIRIVEGSKPSPSMIYKSPETTKTTQFLNKKETLKTREKLDHNQLTTHSPSNVQQQITNTKKVRFPQENISHETQMWEVRPKQKATDTTKVTRPPSLKTNQTKNRQTGQNTARTTKPKQSSWSTPPPTNNKIISSYSKPNEQGRDRGKELVPALQVNFKTPMSAQTDKKAFQNSRYPPPKTYTMSPNPGPRVVRFAEEKEATPKTNSLQSPSQSNKPLKSNSTPHLTYPQKSLPPPLKKDRNVFPRPRLDEDMSKALVLASNTKRSEQPQGPRIVRFAGDQTSSPLKSDASRSQKWTDPPPPPLPSEKLLKGIKPQQNKTVISNSQAKPHQSDATKRSARLSAGAVDQSNKRPRTESNESPGIPLPYDFETPPRSQVPTKGRIGELRRPIVVH